MLRILSFFLRIAAGRLQDNFGLVTNDSLIVVSNINGRTMLVINTCFLLLSTIIFNLFSDNFGLHIIILFKCFG